METDPPSESTHKADQNDAKQSKEEEEGKEEKRSSDLKARFTAQRTTSSPIFAGELKSALLSRNQGKNAFSSQVEALCTHN